MSEKRRIFSAADGEKKSSGRGARPIASPCIKINHAAVELH